jgi:hypothetical protein
MFSATTSLLLQSHAPGSLRGRAIALYGLVYFTLQPIGLVAAGIWADHIGASETLLAMGLLSLAAIGAIVDSNRSIWHATIPAIEAVPAEPARAAAQAAPAAEGRIATP